jgi:hypothetical protein
MKAAEALGKQTADLVERRVQADLSLISRSLQEAGVGLSSGATHASERAIEAVFEACGRG